MRQNENVIHTFQQNADELNLVVAHHFHCLLSAQFWTHRKVRGPAVEPAVWSWSGFCFGRQNLGTNLTAGPHLPTQFYNTLVFILAYAKTHKYTQWSLVSACLLKNLPPCSPWMRGTGSLRAEQEHRGSTRITFNR